MEKHSKFDDQHLDRLFGMKLHKFFLLAKKSLSRSFIGWNRDDGPSLTGTSPNPKVLWSIYGKVNFLTGTTVMQLPVHWFLNRTSIALLTCEIGILNESFNSQ